MSRSTTLSSFPDINVWMAVLIADHVHRTAVSTWWDSDGPELIAFTRLTQIGLLRLLTTSAAMNGKPLTMRQAWAAYDRLFDDDRVVFIGEPAGAEHVFRSLSRLAQPSPKLWADAWLLSVAEQADATVITFDRALAAKSDRCLLLS
jgi:toxin-antitoxin system PIN domain toxin